MDNSLVLGGFLLFLAVWWIVLNLVSRMTGWSKLSAYYRANDVFDGQTWRFQSVSMRMGGGYNNSVTVRAGPRGLHLSLFFLFRPGHPPLFARWGEILVTQKKRLGMKRVELRFQRAADIPLIITARLAEKLARSAGAQWPGPERAGIWSSGSEGLH